MKLTKAQALAIQAQHVAYYSHLRSDLARAVADITTADALQDDVPYDIVIINQHIPRGGAIELLCGLDPNRFSN